MMTNTHYSLLADIGGTYARFGCTVNGSAELHNIQKLKCADYATLEDAINAYLENFEINELGSICMAVAGPIKDNCVNFTNNSWKICSESLKGQYRVNFAKLLNDFEAIAYSLLHLKDDQIYTISETNSSLDKNNFKLCVLGPGSGFGIASLTCKNKKIFTTSSEGGHASFAPINKVQQDIFNALDKKYDRVTNEHLLSGPGIVNIYDAFCKLEGVECLLFNAASIFDEVRNSNNSIAKHTVDIFYEVLGQVAGDIALILNTYDGVFIAGGIAQRYPELLVNSSFRKTFEEKGKQRYLLKNTPTTLITYKYPGLLGASVYNKYYTKG
jgi:glucokinase